MPFEGLGCIDDFLRQGSHSVSATHLYADELLPSTDDFDWLIVLGGPMGVADDAQYPWLTHEKALLKKSIAENKKILGICLGAQLIAEALGANVHANTYKEIGWFPVMRSAEASNSSSLSWMPEKVNMFHWHGDTFDLPAGAISLGSSVACKNQGFVYNDSIVALQFHPEVTPKSVLDLLDHGGADLEYVNGQSRHQYVQDENVIKGSEVLFVEANKVMGAIVTFIEQGV